MAAVGDAAGAWAFIGWFAEHWRSPLRDGDGCPDEEIAAAERRLGLRLPDALASCYRLLGRRGDLTSTQDRLLDPGRLRIDGDVLVFREENQGCAEWGIRVAPPAHPDPPVVFRVADVRGRAPWRPFLGRMSLAAVEMVLFEAVLSDGACDNRELDADTLAGIERRFTRLPVSDYPFWADPDGPPVRWFADPELILREEARGWLWVRGRGTARLDALRAEFPGEWMLRPD